MVSLMNSTLFGAHLHALEGGVDIIIDGDAKALIFEERPIEPINLSSIQQPE